MTVYLLGSLVYLGYVVVFPFVPNLPTVLLSYIFLAVGQTISGISQNVYLQEKLNPLQLNNLYLKIEVLNQVLTGIVVFVQWYAYQERSASHYNLFGIQSSSHYTRFGNNAYD